jgi:hypothetical protein
MGPLDYASITVGYRNIGTDCPYNREGLLGLQRGGALTIHFGLGWEILVLIGTYPSRNLLSKGRSFRETEQTFIVWGHIGQGQFVTSS